MCWPPVSFKMGLSRTPDRQPGRARKPIRFVPSPLPSAFASDIGLARPQKRGSGHELGSSLSTEIQSKHLSASQFNNTTHTDTHTYPHSHTPSGGICFGFPVGLSNLVHNPSHRSPRFVSFSSALCAEGSPADPSSVRRLSGRPPRLPARLPACPAVGKPNQTQHFALSFLLGFYIGVIQISHFMNRSHKELGFTFTTSTPTIITKPAPSLP